MLNFLDFFLNTALIVLVLFILFSVSIVWSILAKDYKTSEHFPEEVLLRRQVRMEGCSKILSAFQNLFRTNSNFNCLWLEIIGSDRGLYLKHPLSSVSFFKDILPPLIIPWNDISQIENCEDRSIGKECYRLKIGNPAIAILTLTKEALETASNYSGGEFEIEID